MSAGSAGGGQAPRRLMIVAGEASGDSHGAALVRELRRADPGLEVFGCGGPRMREAGVDVVFDSKSVAVVGASEVVSRLPTILRVLAWLQAALEEVRPDAVVLIDFPDFNFRVAAAARAAGVPVFYYISPQIWAWRRGRARFLARTVAGMAVIFPFEAELYRAWGLPARFVGHPIMDGPFGAVPDRTAARIDLGLDAATPAIALLPGSRESEVGHHLAPMIAAASLLAREIPGAVFLLPVAPTLDRRRLEGALGGSAAPIRLIEGDAERPASLRVLAAADLAAVKSGTSTVEAALAQVPFVVVYRLSAATYALGRLLVRVPFIAMANLIAGREVAPELVQGAFTPERLAAEIVALHRDPARRERIRAGLAEVRGRLGGPGASARAAEMVLELLATEAEGG